MQEGNAGVLEPASDGRSAQDAHLGRRVAFVASDLTDDDVDELKQQGLTLLERDEDGYTVFVSSADEEMAAEATPPTEDGDEDEGESDEDEEDEKSENDPDEDDESEGADYKGRWIPDQDKFRERPVHGTSTAPGRDLKINCMLDVLISCDRKDATVVKHYMKLEYLKLTLPNFIYTEEQKGHFVHRIIVNAKPTEEWRSKIIRMFAEPSADSHPDILTFQDASAKGVGGTVISTGAIGVQLSYSKSKALSYTDTEYGWSRAEVDDYSEAGIPSWSVKWTWNLRFWKGGQQVFNPEKPWKFNTPFNLSTPWEYFSRPLPELSCYSGNMMDLSNLQENWAEWRSERGGALENMEWDVEVQFFAVKLQKREWSLSHGLKKSYAADALRPGQISTLKVRVNQDK